MGIPLKPSKETKTADLKISYNPETESKKCFEYQQQFSFTGKFMHLAKATNAFAQIKTDHQFRECESFEGEKSFELLGKVKVKC